MPKPYEFKGIYSALPTIFDAHSHVNLPVFQQIIEWQIQSTQSLTSHSLTQEFSGFVVSGTTGESPTLRIEEKKQLIQASKEVCSRSQIIVGVGSNCTQRSIEQAKLMQHWGADAALIVTPYYNKPSAEGLFYHFDQIANAIPDWPWILYVVPGRSHVTVPIDVIERLLDTHDHLVAIKDATGDLVYGAELIQACQGRATVLSGDDPTSLALWSLGAEGSISVASNLYPQYFTQMYEATIHQDYKKARSYFHTLLPMLKMLFLESNPVPLKTLLAQSFIQDEHSLPHSILSQVRPPLYSLEPHNQQQLIECYRHVQHKLTEVKT